MPLYNAGEDATFPPNIPFCGNLDCEDYGKLTVVFKTPKIEEVKIEDEGDKKDKRKKV